MCDRSCRKWPQRLNRVQNYFNRNFFHFEIVYFLSKYILCHVCFHSFQLCIYKKLSREGVGAERTHRLAVHRRPMAYKGSLIILSVSVSKWQAFNGVNCVFAKLVGFFVRFIFSGIAGITWCNKNSISFYCSGRRILQWQNAMPKGDGANSRT